MTYVGTHFIFAQVKQSRLSWARFNVPRNTL